MRRQLLKKLRKMLSLLVRAGALQRSNSIRLASVWGTGHLMGHDDPDQVKGDPDEVVGGILSPSTSRCTLTREAINIDSYS